MKHRFENFGGIVANDNPPFLAFVDRNFMCELGYTESSLWETEDQTINILSAPTEVHFAITNACNVGCNHCYMESGKKDSQEMDTATVKRALKKLQSIGVFHVALGGGEALLRTDLFELAEYARKIGLVPNLTLSGHSVTEEIAKQLTVFGQVNLSIDGINKTYSVFRNPKMFDLADRALTLLVNAGVKTGINCVMGKNNFEAIPQLFKYAKKKKVNEIEFLRLKPTGRGRDLYKKERTTYDQNINLIPLLSKYSKKYKIEAKIDCSFIPMFCYHNPPLDYLEKSATYGCEAGNVLIGAKSNGKINGCSFLPAIDLSIFDFHDQWYTSEYFKILRSWASSAPAPCNSCNYLKVCKGGCHAVALYVSGSIDAPDPDCPLVYNYNP
ncbi:MAG: radical SAM protein [Desulfobacteraceae bacterium]|nr:radical SAM protein [Desulfobacteraceae bacterium]